MAGTKSRQAFKAILIGSYFCTTILALFQAGFLGVLVFGHTIQHSAGEVVPEIAVIVFATISGLPGIIFLLMIFAAAMDLVDGGSGGGFGGLGSLNPWRKDQDRAAKWNYGVLAYVAFSGFFSLLVLTIRLKFSLKAPEIYESPLCQAYAQVDLHKACAVTPFAMMAGLLIFICAVISLLVVRRSRNPKAPKDAGTSWYSKAKDHEAKGSDKALGTSWYTTAKDRKAPKQQQRGDPEKTPMRTTWDEPLPQVHMAQIPAPERRPGGPPPQPPNVRSAAGAPRAPFAALDWRNSENSTFRELEKWDGFNEANRAGSGPVSRDAAQSWGRAGYGRDQAAYRQGESAVRQGARGVDAVRVEDRARAKREKKEASGAAGPQARLLTPATMNDAPSRPEPVSVRSGRRAQGAHGAVGAWRGGGDDLRYPPIAHSVGRAY
ncbi:hypothetical protein PUNSTDRAFT_135085 [Punctularia strigosozonata HHB-11173 SS5]|uniref:uncharacterized protein n=1 Tax=Punctularia strigosozonata (strain HHB-11173) TaxID=741275 RepID=UPI0004417AD1|nr:uncharacterized protein PUNSTDRAFT_135085 [Punctularia strigosozonata HHB-11173 SS5]EIN07559.1 hypothetical protein PUNSTDRAFT_135085 [Punctularia strigosozonata HHB-11173 SS5]